MGTVGIEPTTNGLRGRCTSIVLGTQFGPVCSGAVSSLLTIQFSKSCRELLDLVGPPGLEPSCLEAGVLQTPSVTLLSTSPYYLSADDGFRTRYFMLGKHACNQLHLIRILPFRAPGESRTRIPGLRDQCPSVERQGQFQNHMPSTCRSRAKLETQTTYKLDIYHSSCSSRAA